ncbi:MAG: cytochrome c biogenesis protein CcsA [Lunatimonas sp.]|uniref:cytochrome c biogenesis protein n=1 Tax=Lunatimonas sp. TaxID=2060141 RepID=UPI00263BE513|nr:cytochrome c biogenesis protein CcsA [Lunatimonas sp.]MCC5938754.1 cytochrome c biogenesis protein CcsA [Lunatimonas sp.]
MPILKILTSTKVTLLLLLSFAVAMATATFLENDHGTPVAWRMVYDAWWFEIIIAWIALNFLFHIGTYKLFHPNRWPIGLFHVAFVVILIGAGITRYFSEDGILHIREGDSVSGFFSTTSYLQINKENDHTGTEFSHPLTLHSKGFKPRHVKINLESEPLLITAEAYIPHARQRFEPGHSTYLDVAVAIGKGRQDYLIDQGRYIEMGDITLGTSKGENLTVQLYKKEDQWMIKSSLDLQMMEMSSQQLGHLHAKETQELRLRTLYQWDEGAFMVKEIHENATLTYYEEESEALAKDLLDAVKFSVSDTQGQVIHQFYAKQVTRNPSWTSFEHNGKLHAITYGPKYTSLPFSLYLNDFELKRYPGSQSPASYASEVMVMDGDTEFPYRIYMNNVLDYKGYRFYQASFDSDERGTVLSVNRDRLGTWITYIGYTLLTIGMCLTFFAKGSRFRLLNNRLTKLNQERTMLDSSPSIYVGKLALLGLVAASTIVLWSLKPAIESSPSASRIVPISHAKAYGRLIVQDLDGRMKPLNTLANEIVRKVTGKTRVSLPDPDAGEISISPEQFLLVAQLDPEYVSNIPIIKTDKAKAKEIFEALEIPATERLAFKDFLTDEGAYKIQALVETANLLKPSERNDSHNEILKTDERFNILYGLLTGDFLRLFPNMQDNENTWYTGQQYMAGFSEEDAIFVKNITPLHLQAIQGGLETSDWTAADEALGYLALYQQKAGSEVYPSDARIQAELLYNTLNLGNRLFGPFWLLGIFMLAISIWMLFDHQKSLGQFWRIGKFLAWIGLLAFTFHLLLRWYIAEHPPWSDGFEMLVFVAWCVVCLGLVLGSKSPFTIPLSLLFSGTLLFVGFLDWLNPEITNLMPVLHSYWLKIHVAIIVSGYAPLALSALLALLSLSIIVFKPTKTTTVWWASLRELGIVNELSITIGLFLLTVGTFLGGVWANESWGRYWAWDPKETWALISIIIYAFVLHLRLLPNLKDGVVYNLASMWAFSAIIMTSFGVNYYLSGLHSYAKGDPVPVPDWVYWTVASLILISVGAVIRYKQFSEQEIKNLRV